MRKDTNKKDYPNYKEHCEGGGGALDSGPEVGGFVFHCGLVCLLARDKNSP